MGFVELMTNEAEIKRLREINANLLAAVEVAEKVAVRFVDSEASYADLIATIHQLRTAIRKAKGE